MGRRQCCCAAVTGACLASWQPAWLQILLIFINQQSRYFSEPAHKWPCNALMLDWFIRLTGASASLHWPEKQVHQWEFVKQIKIKFKIWNIVRHEWTSSAHKYALYVCLRFIQCTNPFSEALKQLKNVGFCSLLCSHIMDKLGKLNASGFNWYAAKGAGAVYY